MNSEQMELMKQVVDQIKYLVVQIDELRTDVNSLKTDMSSMKEEMASLKADMSSVKEEVANLKADTDNIKTDMNNLRAYIDKKFYDENVYRSKQFMELNKKIDKNQEINMRQHTAIIELIEKRYQESKDDREQLHQSQDALYFRVKQLETKIN